MSEFKVASRYAKALIDLSEEQQVLESIKDNVASFVKVLKDNKELQSVLKNPIIMQDKKYNILSALFSQRFHPTLLSFFKIMIYKGRSGMLFATALEFIMQYNEVKNIIHAKVVSAVALTEQSKQAITDALTSSYGGSIVLDNIIDPEIIGGFVITVGDQQLDASINGRLNQLERELKH